MVNANTSQNLGSTASASQTPPTCPLPTAAHLPNFTVAGSEHVDSLPLHCPTLNNQSYTFVHNISSQFRFACSRDVAEGYHDEDGNQIQILPGFVAYIGLTTALM